MKKTGRPSKYKPEYCEQLIEHMKEGLGYEIFAAVIGVCDDTLREWEKKHPDFSVAKKRGRALQAIWWHKLGRAASAGKVEGFNATAFVWCTKNMLGWRDKHEIYENRSFDRDQHDGLAQLSRLLEDYRKDSDERDR